MRLTLFSLIIYAFICKTLYAETSELNLKSYQAHEWQDPESKSFLYRTASYQWVATVPGMQFKEGPISLLPLFQFVAEEIHRLLINLQNYPFGHGMGIRTK